jgi:hypothetical protein
MAEIVPANGALFCANNLPIFVQHSRLHGRTLQDAVSTLP